MIFVVNLNVVNVMHAQIDVNKMSMTTKYWIDFSPVCLPFHSELK